MISVCLQGKPFNITVIQVYALTNNAEDIYIAWPTEDSTMTKLFLKSMTVGCFYFVLHLLPSLEKFHPVTQAQEARKMATDYGNI